MNRTVRFVLPKHANQKGRRTRFLYYFSVYVNLFKERFLMSLSGWYFRKASAKVHTLHQTTKQKQEKMRKKVDFS